MKSIELTSDINKLYELNGFIETIMGKKDFHIDLIIEEIFVNIVNYSNTDFIEVNANYVDSTLTVEFIDNGIPFNPLLKDDPKIPNSIEDAKIGGLGIALTKEFADHITYEHKNNENHLKVIKKVE